jgi:two-component system, OmpR family, sensor histidine kinase KdpD
MTNRTAARQGEHKIYLGYAAGVGKTFQMLDDAQSLSSHTDIVIGYFEPHGRKDTIEKTAGLEMMPRRQIVYRGATFEEMDTDAIWRRKPRICLVDELAHTNVPGSERTKRWEDVLVLLDAGIDVWSTVNVQHLESLNDQIWQLTGVRVRETLPDWIVEDAEQVVVVDVTARALLNRLERGAVYSPEKVSEALRNFFTEQNLTALRELALRHAAHKVEEKLPAPPSPLPPAEAERRECILICLDEEPATAALIRRGKHVADYLRGQCIALYVLRDLRWDRLAPPAREAVERHLSFACNLRIETHVIDGRDVARTIAQFARARNATQIFMRRSMPRGYFRLLHGSTVHRVVRLTRDMEVTIVAARQHPSAGSLRQT